MYRIVQIKDHYIIQKYEKYRFLWWINESWSTLKQDSYAGPWDASFDSIADAESYLAKKIDYENKPDFKVIKVIE